MSVSPRILAELAPNGTLRAGINVSNFLLVTGRKDDGTPLGIAPDMAKSLADRLEVEIRYVPYESPGELADAAEHSAWDIGLIGAEPQRARWISFSPAYVEIPATYLVGPNSTLNAVSTVDVPGIRIASTARTAYD